MSNLHPLFEGILATHLDLTPLARATYVSALRRLNPEDFDSADPVVRGSANIALDELREQRVNLDPDGELWKKHAPERFRAEVSA